MDERERQKLRELIGHYDEIAAEAENIRRRLAWAGTLGVSREQPRGGSFPSGQGDQERDPRRRDGSR